MCNVKSCGVSSTVGRQYTQSLLATQVCGRARAAARWLSDKGKRGRMGKMDSSDLLQGANSLPRLFLALIIVVYVALGLLYAANTPMWQAPDEPAQFNYIRTIGDTGTLPVLVPGDYDQGYLEKIKAKHFPPSMSIDSIRYESYQPPLYYLAATPIYLAARPGGLDAEVLALRLFSVLLEAIVLVLGYIILRELMNDPWVALAAVGLMATVPMHIAITASISSDTAAELVLALILLISLRRASRMVSDRRYVLLGGLLFGAALLTKSTAYLPGALLLAGGEVARRLNDRNGPDSRTLAPHAPPGPAGDRGMTDPAGDRGASAGVENRKSVIVYLTNLVPLFLISLVISSPMLIRNLLTYGLTDPLGLGRHNAVVIGQPTTAQLIRDYGLLRVVSDFVTISFKSFWAQFGWMGVPVNDRIYVLLFALTALAVLGLALYVTRVLRNRELLSPTQSAGMVLLAAMLAAGIVDYVLYNFEFFQAQGRYLFAVIIPIALFIIIGWRELVAELHAKLLFVLFYAGMVALDLACLFLFIVPQLRVG